MNDLAFDQIFPNGSQTVDTWTIAKADLPGLIASNSNSPGSLFTAICLAYWYQNQPDITTDSGEIITTISGEQIFCDAMDLFADINSTYWRLLLKNVNSQVYKYDQLVFFYYATIAGS